MDPASYSRLQEEHKKEIHILEERIKQWDKFKLDYEVVQERLQTLPKKLSHDVMVPFGKIAYMPGKLYHTNEVLVLLGDNWFSQCTAHHAWGIAERRKKYINEKLNLDQEQLKEMQARLAFAKQVQESSEGFEDIREEFDSDKEAEWKKAHEERRRQERERLKSENSREQTHEDIWARLEELEEEEEEEELTQEGGRGEGIETVSSLSKRGKSISSDKQIQPSDLSKPSLQIVFKHTESDKVQHGNEDNKSGNGDESRNEDMSGNEVDTPSHQLTPGDIYRQYEERYRLASRDESVSECKSVPQFGSDDSKTKKGVKWAAAIEQTREIPSTVEGTHKKLPMVQRSTPSAFSGQVIERTSHAHSSPDTKHDNKPPKRVSRFKAEKTKTT